MNSVGQTRMAYSNHHAGKQRMTLFVQKDMFFMLWRVRKTKTGSKNEAKVINERQRHRKTKTERHLD